MISVGEAKQRVLAAVHPLAAEQVALGEAAGRFLAQDVIAPFDHPLFDCSAMDGYAFAFGASQWKLVGEVAAGDAFPRALVPGECVRIFTGAMIPEGADTVVMQERVQRNGDLITHSDVKLKEGGNVRYKGEQLRAGEVVVHRGVLLDAGAIGLLASVGVRKLHVAARPRVALLITGNEFAEDAMPKPGKIFGSNGAMLQAALRKEGIEATVVHAGDDREALVRAWKELSPANDLILSTGGVSVGDHDLVPPTLNALQAEIIFHGVRQKPGKPMLFGFLGGTAVFGLPGNPRAVMVLVLEYVLPFLRSMQGCPAPWMRSEALPIHKALRMNGDRAEFRAAHVEGGKVRLLADEGSHMLRSLTEANAIAFIPAEVRELKMGDPMEVHFIHS